MSKIQFEQIDDNLLEVTIPDNTPIEMVEQLTKSFKNKGLIEDRNNSTLCTRYYYRPEDKVNELADQLIKSLQGLTKNDELPYWHPKSQFANQKRVREMEISERRAQNGIKQPSNVSTAPEPHIMAPAAPKMPNPGTLTPQAYTAPHPKIVDTNPAAMNTAGGTGRRYGTIGDTAKAEHVDGCQCVKCLEMNKSNYGPKGAGQYSAVDNAKRKANNLDPVGVGPNVNAKAYSSKPGQLSGKEQSNLTARIQNAANKKQPVKTWTPEMIAAENEKRGLKKAWADHLPFPSAEEEIMKLAKNEPIDGEAAAATQLMNLMVGKSMLGVQPPPQPTDDQLFGGGVVTEEMAKAAEHKWNNTFTNWMQEAQKPIAQRFASEEEELAYWANIKVSDRDDGQSGY